MQDLLSHHSVNEIVTDQNYLIFWFRYFILFWHAIVFTGPEMLTSSNKQKPVFFGPIFYLEFCGYCAGIPAPGPPLFIQELSKCHVILASSYWSDAKMWCTLFIQIGVPSQILTSHFPSRVSQLILKNFSRKIALIIWGTWRARRCWQQSDKRWRHLCGKIVSETKIMENCFSRPPNHWRKQGTDVFPAARIWWMEI